MAERHLVGEEWIDVPDCITAQGGDSVALFLTLPAKDRALEIAQAQSAAQARHAARRAAWIKEQEEAAKAPAPATEAPDQATKE